MPVWRFIMKKQPKKMKLNRESLYRLTSSPAGAPLAEVVGGAATFPPVCENTNYISCLRC
jgi:hypothetical protein